MIVFRRTGIFTDGAGRDQDIDLRLALLPFERRDKSAGALPSPAVPGNCRFPGCRSARIPMVGASAVASRRGWMSRLISPSCPGRLTWK